MARDFREIIPNNREPISFPLNFKVTGNSLILEKEIAQTLISRFVMLGLQKKIAEKDYSNYDFSQGFNIGDNNEVVCGNPNLKLMINRLLEINGILQVRISCYSVIIEICEHFIYDKQERSEVIQKICETISQYLESIKEL